MKSLRRYFVAGLAALFPITVTIYLVVALFRFSERFANRTFGFTVPGLGLLITLVIILAVGYFSSHTVSRLVFPTVDAVFRRIPVIKSIYPAIHQLTRFLFPNGEGRSMLRQVVIVEYPKTDIWSPAFVTNETQMSALDGRTMLTLLIPTPPSPFSGPMIFVPKESVIPLSISVEDALKLVVSGGVVSVPLNKDPVSPGGTTA